MKKNLLSGIWFVLFFLSLTFNAFAISYNDIGPYYSGSTSSWSATTIGKTNIYGKEGPDYVYKVLIYGACTLEVNTCGCGWDSYLWVLDSSETPLGYDDDSCGSGSSKVSGISIPSSGYYYIVVDGYDASSQGNFTLTLTSSITPTALNGGSISIGTTTVSSGCSPGTFSSVAASGGTGTYAYQWQQSADNSTWTNISGATSETYTVPALTNTTYYRRMVTSSYIAYTNVITITVTIPTLNAGSISISTTSVISGSSPGMFSSAAASGGTGNYFYQWQQSADFYTWSNISGQTSATYTVPPLTNSTYYRRMVTSGSYIAYSNVVTITVTTPTLNAGSISISTTSVGSGSSPGMFSSVAASGGTGNYSYQWQQSADFSTWSNISGQTSATYTVPSLTASIYYRRIVTSGSSTAYSNEVLIYVIPPLSGGSITITTTTVSSGNSPGAFTNSTAASGGTGPYSYQWQQSADNSTWSNISGQTTTMYVVPVLTTTTYYRRMVTADSSTAYSNTIAITVPLSGGSLTISSFSVNSGNSPGSFTSLFPASGGSTGSSYTYQWQQSPDNSNWTNISGANNETYTVPVLYYSTYYRRQVTNGSSTTYSNSALISVTINAGSISIGTTSVISGNSPGTFNSVAASGGTGTYSY